MPPQSVRRDTFSFFGLVLLALTTLLAVQSKAAAPPTTPEDPDPLITRAYNYALPVYEIARLRYQQSFNPANPHRLPLNTLSHSRALADYTSRQVTTPNNDTLYSLANLDLRAGPVRIDVPNFGQRYYSIALMDEFTNNFAYIGRRTTGTKAGSFLVVGPIWRGQAPQGVKVIHAPTPDVTLLVRILVDGPDDLDAVHRLQDAIVLTAPPIIPSAHTPVAPLANDGPNFVDVVNQALGENPPPAQDVAVLAEIAKVGIVPGGGPLTPELARIWRENLPKAQTELRSATSWSRRVVDGWSYSAPGTGNFGTDYDLRASVALSGLLALTREEAIYAGAVTDSKGRPLDGTYRYRLRVPKDLPLDGFWSLSMYEVQSDGRLFFSDNPLHRYAIGDRTRGLKHNSDGSLDILIQKDAPAADLAANWLPVPESGRLQLTLRLYQPRAEILNGRFHFPALERLD
jgi:hypothetical protein